MQIEKTADLRFKGIQFICGAEDFFASFSLLGIDARLLECRAFYSGVENARSVLTGYSHGLEC